MVPPSASDANRKDAFSMLQSVLGVMLPLIGTWMGTILAFYFSRENFEAASRSVNDIFNNVTSSKAKFESKNAYEESRKTEDIEYNKAIVDKTDQQILVEQDIYNFITSNNKGDRLPVINAQKIIRCVIHLNTVNDFLLQVSIKKFSDLDSVQKSKLTLFDMGNKSNEKISNLLIKGIEFVGKESTLAEVQIKMKANEYCQDVFITATGKRDEPIMGWITNNRLNELSKA